MSYEAGTAFLQVVPSFAGVVESISEEFTKDGRVAGEAFKQSFRESVSDLNVTVDLNDALAKTKLDTFDADIDRTAAKSPSVKVDVDGAARAVGELEAVNVAADSTAGSGGVGGFSGLAASVGESGAEFSTMIPLIGLAVTALVPLTGLALGGLSTLPAIMAGFAAGIGAVVIAAHPLLDVVKWVFTPLVDSLRPFVEMAILPGVESGVRSLASAFSALAPFVISAASGIGSFVQKVGAVLNSGPGLWNLAVMAQSGIGFMNQLGDAFVNLLPPILTIGAQATPILKAIGDGILNMVHAFGSWVANGGFERFLKWLQQNGPSIVNGIKEFVVGLVKLLIALVPVGDTVLQIVGPLGQMLSWLARTPAVLAGVTLALGAFGIALAIAMDSNPVGLIITAIALLVIGIVVLVTRWSQIWEQIKSVFDRVVAFLRSGFGTLVVLITGPIAPLLLLALHWQQVWGFMRRVYEAVILPVLHGLQHVWNVVWRGIRVAIDIAEGAIKVAIVLILIPIALLVLAIKGLLKVWTAIWGVIGAPVMAAWSWMKGTVFDPAVRMFTQTIPNAIGTMLGFFFTIVGRISSALAGVWGTITGAFGDIAGWVNVNIIQPVIGFFGGIGGAIGGAMSTVAGAIEGPFKSAFNAVAGFWNRTVGGFGFTVPSWVPFVGGKGFNIPDMPTLHEGGMVPGVPGTDVPAILQAGELVISRSDLAGLKAAPTAVDSRPSVTIPQTIIAYDPRTAAVEAFDRAGFAMKTRGY